MSRGFAKPVRLELKNSGSWKVLGRFDAADGEQTSLVSSRQVVRVGKKAAGRLLDGRLHDEFPAP